MATLMFGAVSMHLKVKDPLQRSLPAFCLLVLPVLIAALSQRGCSQDAEDPPLDLLDLGLAVGQWRGQEAPAP
jgi:hypothetical protein